MIVALIIACEVGFGVRSSRTMKSAVSSATRRASSEPVVRHRWV
ncbi:hypothetical protein SALBM217S_02925 [Streptomyces griseoloalbus]